MREDAGAGLARSLPGLVDHLGLSCNQKGDGRGKGWRAATQLTEDCREFRVPNSVKVPERRRDSCSTRDAVFVRQMEVQCSGRSNMRANKDPLAIVA